MQLPEVEPLLENLVSQLRPRMPASGWQIVGIHSGGVWLAERLRGMLGVETAIGSLDISFYRDDFGQAGLHPAVRPSHLPFEIDGRALLLVDDILYTGRTVRAALNELFDYGRPAKVDLAVLVSRNGRELPIEASAAGIQLDVGDRHLKLRGPEPLRLELIDPPQRD